MREQWPFRFGGFHAGHGEFKLCLEGRSDEEFGPLAGCGNTSIADDGMTHKSIIANKDLILMMEVSSTRATVALLVIEILLGQLIAYV